MARAIQDSAIAHAAPCTREVWSWIIKEANHKNNSKLGIKRGEMIRTIGDIQDGLKWFVGYRKQIYSANQIEKALKFLRSEAMIVTTKTTRGIRITVCKYDTYQDFENYEGGTKVTTKDEETAKDATKVTTKVTTKDMTEHK